MRKPDKRTREQRKADASARIAAVCLFLAVLLIIVAALTVKTTGQPYKGEPPVIEDKLPDEDKPAEGSAELTIGEPLGEFKLTAYCKVLRQGRRHHGDRHDRHRGANDRG
jgi:hypothetical protein